MEEKRKEYLLVLCLFVFLFVIIGGGLHLNPSAAFVPGLLGTPLVIYAFNHRSAATHRPMPARSLARDNGHSLGGGELEDHAGVEMGQQRKGCDDHRIFNSCEARRAKTTEVAD